MAVSVRRVGGGIDRRTLARRARKILIDLGRDNAELSIVVCDDVMIRELNSEYRGKDRPTDVLSFPMLDDDDGGDVSLLGDVVISLETATRQARSRKHPLLTEVTFLLIHGILHLVGYDHRDDDEEAAMDDESRRLMSLF